MTLAVDASSPDMVTSNANTVTTADFTPPAGALLIGMIGTYHYNVPIPTHAMSDSRGVCWQLAYRDTNSNTLVYWTTVPESVTMSVTYGQLDTGYNVCAIQVIVFTGAKLSNPLPTMIEGTSVVAVVSQAITTKYDGSQVWLVNFDIGAQAVPTPAANTTTYSGDTWVDYAAGTWTVWFAKLTAAVAVASTVTIASTAPTTGTINNWIALEVAEEATLIDTDGMWNKQVELYIDSTWVDVTSRVRNDPGITVTRGSADEATTVSATKLTLQLNNADGLLSNRNPNSIYYGLLGRNIAVRYTIDNEARFYGEISDLPPRWDESEHDAWLELTASGSIRRLTQGAKPLKGALPRFIESLDPLAYWPLDDGTSAASGGSTVSGQPGFNSDAAFTWSAITGPNGAPSNLPEFAQDITGSLPALTTKLNVVSDDTWTLDFIFRGVLQTGVMNSPIPIIWYGTNSSWYVQFLWQSGVLDQVTVHGIETDTYTDQITITVADAASAYADGEWHHFRIESTQITTTSLSTDVIVDDVVIGSGTGTFYQGGITEVTVMSTDSTYMSSMSTGHIAVYDAVGQPDMYQAMLGWPNETAGDRITRLCSEKGVPLTVIGPLDTTAAMGPQPVATFMGVLSDCATVDGGILCDSRVSIGLIYTTRDALCCQTGVIIDYSQAILSGKLEPAVDDFATANRVTVARNKGSSSVYTKTTGSLNVNDPGDDPNGVGLYDVQYTWNVYSDTQLAHAASWLVGLGTVDQVRYPTLTLELHRSEIRSADVTLNGIMGSDVPRVLTLVNLPVKFVGNDDAKLIIRGYTETLNAKLLTIKLNCTPANGWDVGIYNSNSRYDTALSTLSSAINTTDTTIYATFTTNRWVRATDDAASLPFDIKIGGEIITVTAVSGTTSPQTFTVTRSVNGVVKSHSAGSGVSLAHPSVYAR
jgi:hypothetical protein